MKVISAIVDCLGKNNLLQP